MTDNRSWAQYERTCRYCGAEIIEAFWDQACPDCERLIRAEGGSANGSVPDEKLAQVAFDDQPVAPELHGSEIAISTLTPNVLGRES